MKNEHDFKGVLGDMPDSYPEWTDEDFVKWVLYNKLTIQAALEIAAEQKTVDVVDLKRFMAVRPYILDIEDQLDNNNEFGVVSSVQDALPVLKEVLGMTCLDEGCPYYNTPHAHPTPDTEKDRVLELMAEAVSKILQKFDKDHSDSAWWYTTSDEVSLLEEAISEYKKLKGGA